jgi:hypothetical protein
MSSVTFSQAYIEDFNKESEQDDVHFNFLVKTL